MALLGKNELREALTRLGELARDRGENIELILLGGTIMVLVFNERQSTMDVDVVIMSPQADRVREMVALIAQEKAWPLEWLNDAAKGYFIGETNGPVIFSAPGLNARRPSFEQLLAMKLCAWRDDVDVSDARRLLRELPGTRDEIWGRVKQFLQPGRELKAGYAFDDLWEERHGSS